MSSMIRLMCPNLKCKKILTVPASTRGKTVRCRNCGIRINVPAPSSSPAPQPAETTTAPADEPMAD